MRLILAIATIFGFTTAANAALDPETNSLYHLRIVLRTADHREFTKFFRDELLRELKGNLQAALGHLGTVEVVDLNTTDRDKWEPLWKQVEEKGLQSLDSFNEVGGGKTHFLRIEYRDGEYELQTRQVDGTCGYASPIVRRSSTPSRTFISRMAGLMIGQDFGIVATLEPGAGPNSFVKFKGGELGIVDKWVKKGEVFAVVQINIRQSRAPAQPGAKGPPKIISVISGSRVEGVLLRAISEPKNGGILCQMFSRYSSQLPTAGVIGYRLIKLGTTEAPLRIQLTDNNKVPHIVKALQVFARGEDFPDTPKETEQTVSQDGVYVSKEKFANVAFIRVMMSNKIISKIPVEILDDQVQMRGIRLDPGAEIRDRIDADRRGILGRIVDSRLIQVRCFDEILAFEREGKKLEALERGQSVLKTLDSASNDLLEETDKLKERASSEAPTAVKSISECSEQLEILKRKQQDLREHLESLKVAIAEDKDPNVVAKKKRVTDALNRADLLFRQAEYDQVLKAYEEAMEAVGDDEATKRKIDEKRQKLKNEWALKEGDSAHAQARQYIYEKWPKLGSIREIQVELPNARTAFEKCKNIGDRLTLNKMYLAGVEVSTRFGEELKRAIDSANDEEDKKSLERNQKVSEDLQKLLKDIEAVVVKN